MVRWISVSYSQPEGERVQYFTIMCYVSYMCRYPGLIERVPSLLRILQMSWMGIKLSKVLCFWWSEYDTLSECYLFNIYLLSTISWHIAVNKGYVNHYPLGAYIIVYRDTL